MKRFLSRYAAAGLLLALQACTTLGPDYAEPEVDWVEVWESDLYGRASSVDTQTPVQQDLTFWWEAFNDPVPNPLIETAREENPGLRLAGLAIAQSRALLGIAAGSRYPQLQQANGAVARVDSWPTEGDDSGDHSNINSYSVGFDVGWEIDFWGKFRRATESARAELMASEFALRTIQLSLISAVASMVLWLFQILIRLG